MIPFVISTLFLLAVKYPLSLYETLLLFMPLFVLLPLYWGIGRYPVFYFEEAEKSINNSFGIMPFYGISEVPPGAEWERITEASNEQFSVYELRWISDTFYDDQVFNKLRFTLKSDTSLPVKLDFYRKFNNESDYSLESYITIDYPGDEEIASIQKQVL